MEITQLRTLIHVAELGSLSKAADRMRIAQPALSRHIRLLEEELKTRLFERHGRGMVITETGREVLGRALRIVAELDGIRSSVADADGALAGRIVVGMPPTVGDILAVALVRTMREAHPKLEIHFVTAFSGYLVDWLQRAELDVAVLYDPQLTRSLRSRPLLLESLILVGPPDAGLSLEKAESFSRLGEETMLLPSLRHGLRVVVEQCATQANIALKVDIEADSLHTLKDLVHNGFGFTVLPLAPIYQDVVAGRLSAAPLSDPSPARRLMLSYSIDRPVSRGARFASESIAMIVSDFVSRGIWKGHLLEPQSGSAISRQRGAAPMIAASRVENNLLTRLGREAK